MNHPTNLPPRSVVEGPLDFDPSTLTSALRISTIYDYPALRDFAIENLEKTPSNAVERIRLAREFGLASWEEPAYVELCKRDEAINESEASVIGLGAFVRVARIREKEQRRRGKEVDATIEDNENEEVQDEKQDAGVVETPPTSPSPPKIGAKKRGRVNKVARLVPATSEPSAVEEGQLEESKAPKDEKRDRESNSLLQPLFYLPPCQVEMMKPCFIDTSTPGAYSNAQYDNQTQMIELMAPDCECSTIFDWGFASRPCKLPPCAVSAFKHLQNQQLVHTNNIATLETTIDQLQAARTPNPESEPDLVESSSQFGTVQEEVRRWMAGREYHVTCMREYY